MPTETEIISSAMSILGKRKSKRKAAAARRNGKLGGFTAEMRRRALAKKIAGSSHQKRVAKRAALRNGARE